MALDASIILQRGKRNRCRTGPTIATAEALASDAKRSRDALTTYAPLQ